MRKIKKSVRLSDEHIGYIMSVSEDIENFSECLEILLEKARLQDEFIETFALRNQFVKIAKANKKTMESSIRIMHKNNRLIDRFLESTEKMLFLCKYRKEVDEYNDKLKEIKRNHTNNPAG